MAQPIYKLFLAKPSEAWHRLSEDEQNSLATKLGEAFESVGGKRPIQCNSAWASEQWPFWGVEQFPDIEAVQKYTELLSELNWFRYFEATTVLGTEWRAA